MPCDLHQFVCLQDNYGVLLHDRESGATAAVDAPDAVAVEQALNATGWRLTDILVTHHHGDHTAGIPALKARHGARVTAPRAEAARIPEVDVTVAQGDRVAVGSLRATVLDTPGHTAGHVSYVFEEEGLAFVGDTLFSIGCGRILEGTPEMMWDSLLKLRGLPDGTRVYCGHEYTASNVAFALTIEPENATLQRRAREVRALRAKNEPTLPTTIGDEKAANPFLRADVPSVAAALGLDGGDPARVFAKLRGAKDAFRG